jgi:hypothetical protein
MEKKEEKEMTGISVPGNEGGFALLDALICLFMATLTLLFLSCVVSGILRSSSRALYAGVEIIEERNNNTALLIEKEEYDEQ